MTFFSQTWSGIKQEFTIYKRRPRFLFQENASVILAGLILLPYNFTNFIQGRKDPPVFFAIWISIVFYSPIFSVLNKLLRDKETKFRQYLIVNGMRKSSYLAKTALTSYILIFFIALEKTVEFVIFEHRYPFQTMIRLFALYFASGIASINFALFLSTCLKASLASIAAFLLFILIPLFMETTAEPGIEVELSFIQAFCFINPPTTSNFLIKTFPELEEYRQRIPQWINSSQNSNFSHSDKEKILHSSNTYAQVSSQWNTTFQYSLIALLFHLCLYLFIEREKEGSRKKTKDSMKVSQKIEIELGNSDHLLQDPHPIDQESLLKEDINSALYREGSFDEKNSKKTIKIKGLKKVYGPNTVLDNVSLTLYEQEIFCLLGHNGAGKTTLVNILTGLIPCTEGKFYYSQREFSSILELRQSVGFCAQQDFAFENNTVYENLQFFAEIKNVPKHNIATEIQRVLDKFDLTEYQDIPASQLTAGWKRKLNIAISLINDPKIIIMDEPTSGMDPITRREYWEIIQKLKQEKKTVVITTQFLDEAEELCDRVAILSKGRLFAMGSVDYIKKKFGIGYNLVIEGTSSKDKLENQAFQIMAKINQIIPASYYLDDSTASILKYVLPFSEQNKFAELFTELEKLPNLNINLQLISLEEAFAKLEMNSDCIIGRANNHNDEFKARLKTMPSAFYEDRMSNIFDQMVAIWLQRLYRLQEDPKERWTHLVSIVLFSTCSLWYFCSLDFYAEDTVFLTGGILLSSSCFAPIFTSFVVSDRVNKITYALKVQGVRPISYWLANLIADFLLQIPLMIIIILSFNHDKRLQQGRIYDFIILYSSYLFSLITFSYNLSLKLRNSQWSWIAGPPVICGNLLIAGLVADFFNSFHVDIDRYVLFASGFWFGPSCGIYLGASRIINSSKHRYGPGTLYLFDKPWPYAILMIAMGVLDFVLVVYRDSQVKEPPKIKNTNKECRNNQPLQPNQIGPELELLDEKMLTLELQRLISRNNKDVVKVIELEKIYKNGKKALDNLSFGVQQGQIFCLLGINGAGKTTCFDVLTNSTPKTAGDVEIQDQQISDFYKNSSQVGVCAQANTLWPRLTLQQHLAIYARVRGLKGSEAEQVIQYLLDALQLEACSQQKVSELSLGTQRKLCVALSVIGGPKILFLDEPSTGVDPIGRSQIWDLVKAVSQAKQSATIVTTYYMQEAELIADKLGILVNGTLQTVGSLVDIKRSYADYTILIKMIENGASKAKLNKIVTSVFPNAANEESTRSNEMIFRVPGQSMRFSYIFDLLYTSRQEGEIEDFSIFTTSLEQIFIRLVKEQMREKHF